MASCQRYFLSRLAAKIRLGPIDDPRHVKIKQLQRVAGLFLDGFGMAAGGTGSPLDRQLGTFAHVDRGVAFEGAAAGSAVSDLIRHGNHSESSLLLKNNPNFSFLIFLGIGEALAQLKMPPQLCNSVANERWSGQIIEGYGFFDGYFNWYEAIVKQRYPIGLAPSLRAAYDQGLGRAIFFMTNCNPALMRDYISSFHITRRAEMWSGAGIPIAYVGGNSERELKKLLDFAGHYRAELMQGVLLGASARTQQALVPDHTEMACNIICGESAIVSVDYTDRLSQLLVNREQYSMFDWQLSIRQELRCDGV